MDRTLSKFFLSIILFLVFIIVALYLIPTRLKFSEENSIAQRFLLTDLCLTTESRHTRNITFIEPIAPFQDAPGFYDHFPSWTFLRPDKIQYRFKVKSTITF